MELALIFLTLIIALLSPLLFWLLLKWLIPLSLPVLVLFAARIFFLIVLCFYWLIPPCREQLKRLMIWFNKVLRKKAEESATHSFGATEYEYNHYPSSNGVNPEKSPKKSGIPWKALAQSGVLILGILYYGINVGKEAYKIIEIIRIFCHRPSSSAPPMQPKLGPPTSPPFSPLPKLLQKEDPYQIDIDADMDLESMEEGVRLFYAEAFFKRGAHLWKIGSYNQALKVFEQAKLFNPNLSKKIQQMYPYP